MGKIRMVAREGGKLILVSTTEQLATSLAGLAAQAKAAKKLNLVELHMKSKSLALALGGRETVVVFGSKGRKPPFCHSRGKGNAVEPVLTCYSKGKYAMEIPRRLVIPIGQGMKAALEFAATGERPTSIKWEEMVD